MDKDKNYQVSRKYGYAQMKCVSLLYKQNMHFDSNSFLLNIEKTIFTNCVGYKVLISKIMSNFALISKIKSLYCPYSTLCAINYCRLQEQFTMFDLLL